jgi:ribulose-5-phosphate 4-epimerase/fuculose-1-phosphate aldolase
MGVSTHRFGLLPISQHSMRFYGELKYHDFKGFEFDHDMTPRLLKDLDGGYYALLRNHGALICGHSVAECVTQPSLAGDGLSGPGGGAVGRRGELFDPRPGGL